MCMYQAAFYWEERQPVETAGGAQHTEDTSLSHPCRSRPLGVTALYSCRTCLYIWTLAIWVPKCRDFWLPSFSSPIISFSVFKKGTRVLCLNSLGENGARQALSAAQPTAVGADVSRA